MIEILLRSAARTVVKNFDKAGECLRGINRQSYVPSPGMPNTVSLVDIARDVERLLFAYGALVGSDAYRIQKQINRLEAQDNT